MDDLTGNMQKILSDPESMQQLSELAAMFRNETPDATPAQQQTTGLDPGILLRFSELMQTQGAPDQNAALLLALKPYLGQRRQQRTDKALRMLRLYSLWKAAKQSGMLKDLM